MKILVTGSAGFIGYFLCKQLLEQGYQVIGYDNFNDYYDPALKEARTRQIAAFPHYTLYRADLTDLETLKMVFETEEVELVCNLAAQPGVRYSLINPFAYQKSNLEGFLNILELSRHYQVKRLVYASSSSVYGGIQKVPFSERMPLDIPVSLYAATKKSNELMSHVYSHLFGLTTVGLRFFTVYGPWSRPDMATWIFSEAILKGKPIKVYNYGDMRRDFTFIDDIIDGIMASLFTELEDKYNIFNLGNHRSEELLKLISLIEENLGIKAQTELLPIQPGDVKETYADISKAEAILGYQPKTSLEEGIPIFINWFNDYLN